MGDAAGSSVGLYVLLPLIPPGSSRASASFAKSRPGGRATRAVADFTARIKPASVIGLLATVVILFGFQGNVIVERPLVILLIAIPLLIQAYGIFFLAYAAAKAWKVPFNIAAPCALIGTSNFFELAVAGCHRPVRAEFRRSPCHPVVGVLVEVPSCFRSSPFANRTKHWFPEES